MVPTKSTVPGLILNRRTLLSALPLVAYAPGLLNTALAQEAANGLASWNDGPAKQSILDFVRATTDRTSPKFVPPEERIATFDQDGTLWVEHPMYTQVVYCLDRVSAVSAQKPELKDVEPFKTVLSGDREAMAKLTLPDLEKIIFATLTGMTTDAYANEARKWIETAKHPRWSSPISPCLKFCNTCGPMRLGLSSSPAVGRILCASTQSGSMEFLQNRWWVPASPRSTLTTRTAGRSS
jgi:hypothetical protein